MSPPSRATLDALFPTAVRYVGLAIMVYATLFDRLERPSLIVAATGMMLFKTVLNGGGQNSRGQDGEDLSREDRWSHLP